MLQLQRESQQVAQGNCPARPPSNGADFSSKWDKPAEPVVEVAAATGEAKALPLPSEG